jgi:hypothetical protein
MLSFCLHVIVSSGQDDPESHQAEAEAGQSSGERQVGGGSTSKAGARRRAQTVELDPSILPNYVIKEGDSAV